MPSVCSSAWRTRALALAFATLHASADGDQETARRFGEEAVGLARSLSDPLALAEGLRGLSVVYSLTGEDEAALRAAEECLEIAGEHGFTAIAHDVRNNLGYHELIAGRYERAAELLEEAVAVARAGSDVVLVAYAEVNLAFALLKRGQRGDAARSCAEALRLAREHGLMGSFPDMLAVASRILIEGGETVGAARAVGAVSVLMSGGARLSGAEQALFDETVSAVGERLGEGHARVERDAGGRLPIDDVIAEVVGLLVRGR